jgi:hypothetical protein
VPVAVRDREPYDGEGTLGPDEDVPATRYPVRAALQAASDTRMRHLPLFPAAGPGCYPYSEPLAKIVCTNSEPPCGNSELLLLFRTLVPVAHSVKPLFEPPRQDPGPRSRPVGVWR